MSGYPVVLQCVPVCWLAVGALTWAPVAVLLTGAGPWILVKVHILLRSFQSLPFYHSLHLLVVAVNKYIHTVIQGS